MITTPIGKPWQMLAVDVLKVPPSSQGNTYLLVLQDYFTKWLEAIPMKDQKANTIVTHVIKIFSTCGVPKNLHSDQGSNFESTIMRHTCAAFGVRKTHTTPYHPQGDGMVERSNRSIIKMLRAYCEKECDWERWLPMLLFAYRTAQHKSTKFSPYTLMFGREAREPLLVAESHHDVDSQSYHVLLKRKLAELYEIVDANLVQAGVEQKKVYDKGAQEPRQFKEGDAVWLSNPTASKLQVRWEGGWRVKQVVPRTLTIKLQHDSGRLKTVHINRVRLRGFRPSMDSGRQVDWETPDFEHIIINDDDEGSPTRNDESPSQQSARPERNLRPPLRCGFSDVYV
jgi:hypothetical protein